MRHRGTGNVIQVDPSQLPFMTNRNEFEVISTGPTMQKMSDQMPEDSDGLSPGDQKRQRLQQAASGTPQEMPVAPMKFGQPIMPVGDTFTMPPDTEPLPPAMRNVVPYPDEAAAPSDTDNQGVRYRQPLYPTDPEATTGQEYDPRDADQGPRESGYVVPADPATYGSGGDDAGNPPISPNSPSYSFQNGGDPIGEAPSYEMPLTRSRPGQVAAEMANGGELTPTGTAEAVEMPIRPATQAYDPRDADQGAHELPPPSRQPEGIDWMAGARNLGAAAYTNVIQPALATIDAANEWAINSPLGNLNPQAWGRELAGWEQLGRETEEDQTRLNALVARFRAGDTSVEPEIQALTASLNQRLGKGRSMRETLLQAGERNPDKTAEGLGQVVQGAAAMSLAPGLHSGAIRNAAAAALDPVGQAVGSAIEAPGRLIEGAGRVGQRIRGALDANAERVAAADARMAQEGSTATNATLGQAGENRRMYHGTAGAFERPDPGKFDPNGLYGPGYYLTDDARVANSYAMAGAPQMTDDAYEALAARAEQLREQATRQGPQSAAAYRLQNVEQNLATEAARRQNGPNVRAVDVPSELHLIDIERPLREQPDTVNAVYDAISDPVVARRFDNTMRDQAARNGGATLTGDNLWQAIESAYGDGRLPTREQFAQMHADLQAAGIDGLTHEGGKIVPLMDDSGQPISHNVTVVFPHGLERIRNAFSGEVGGATLGMSPSTGAGLGTRLAADVGSSAGSGVMGAAIGAGAPSDSDEDRARNALTGAAIGMVAGPAASRLMRRSGGAMATLGASPGDEAARAGRIAREQRITSDYGRPYPDVRGRIGTATERALGEPSAEMLADSRFPREAVHPDIRANVSEPITEAPNMAGRANAALPFDPSGAALGAGAGAASEDDEGQQGDPLRTAAGVAVGGILGRNFPGVQRAVQASQVRAARMAAQGIKPLSPLQWTGKLAESVGYSSMIGIRTATTNLLGNVGEPIWAGPKEAARGAARAISTGNASALREPGEMFYGAAHGLWSAGGEMVDALANRGRYMSPDHPTLSAQTVNPILHAIATVPEVGGRVFSGLPDALFGSIARGAGEAREAAQIATGANLKGPAWKQRVSQILADRDDIMAGTPPTDAQRLADAQQAIKAGGLYAKDQTFQNELGTIGKGVEKVVRLGNAPILGKLVTPFFNTPWNMKVSLAERTPLGAVMNTHSRAGTTRTSFDKGYDALVGTTLIGGLVATVASQGRVTGSGPDDEGQRALMRENGWTPQSTLVRGSDGQDYYVQNNKFGIYGTLLNAVGEVHDALAYGKKDATSREQLISTSQRFGRMFQNEAQLRGLSDLLGAITDPGRNAIGYAGDLATRLTPYAATARDISTSQDTMERETDRGKNVPITDEITQRWQSGTGQRAGLPIREGLRGPDENQSQGIWAFFPKASKAKNDPVVQTFLNANVNIPRQRTEVTVENKIPERQRPSGQPSSYQVPLTPTQTRMWENARNRELVRLTESAFKNPLWDQMAPGAQQQLLQRYVDASAKTADTAILTRPDMQAVTQQAIRDQQTKSAERYRTGTR
jgi:hypothetical protein